MTRKSLLIAVVVLMMVSTVVAQTCSVRCYFVSPDVDGVIETAIIQAINGAKKSLDIALFSFTDDQLGNAVVQAHRRGVSVRILLAGGQDRVLGAEHGKLVNANVAVAVAQGRGYFHHSFAIIDGQLVITGSYDWSDAADQHNYENVAFIDCPVLTAAQTVAERYANEFERLWRTLGGETLSQPQATVVTSAVTLILIDAVDPIGECIQLLNISSVDLDLAGWSISDLEGRYTFPAETLVHPNDPYRVCIDTYNPTNDPQGLYLNDVHDEVFLATPEGKIVDEVVW